MGLIERQVGPTLAIVYGGVSASLIGVARRLVGEKDLGRQALQFQGQEIGDGRPGRRVDSVQQRGIFQQRRHQGQVGPYLRADRLAYLLPLQFFS